MFSPVNLIIPRKLIITPYAIPRTFNAAILARPLRRCLQKSLQRRCYAQPPARSESELKRQARAVSKNKAGFELPERLIIYHAGTGRTTFLAMFKVTTLFMGAFFCFIATPAYIKDEKPAWETARVFLSGLIPVIFVALVTSSFVTHIHLHLPGQARASKAALEHFAKAVPPSTQLTLTTMSAISKPRYSTVCVGDLSPANKRFGLVNYVRDTSAENANRKWYNLRAVGGFYVQETKPTRRVRYETQKKGVVSGWLWDSIRDQVAKRAVSAGAS